MRGGKEAGKGRENIQEAAQRVLSRKAYLAGLRLSQVSLGEGNYRLQNTQVYCLIQGDGEKMETIGNFNAKVHRDTKTLTFNHKITECFSYPSHLIHHINW